MNVQKQESRVKRTLLNARVNLTFYMLSLLLSFFTRKIFLDQLGVDFVGLTATLQNILGFLNLAELGVSSAIGYVLYRPIFNQDKECLNEIISLFGYVYRLIGFVILGVGIILSAFLPLIFSDITISFGALYFVYYSLLFSSLLGYLVNYKQTLLAADQKSYVISGYMQSTVIVKTIIQAALAYYTQNYYIWAANEIIFGIIFSVILNWRICKTYPWLKSDIRLGRSLLTKYPEIFRYTKQLFVHKIAIFMGYQTTPFFLYCFVSLDSVALYGNYTIITDKLSTLVDKLLGSTSASVGNLITEGRAELCLQVFEELIAIRFFIAGVLVFGLYNLMEPFILLWLGEEYLLGHFVLVVISIRLLISLSQGVIDQFLYGYGLFQDTWHSSISVVASIVITSICGYYWQMNGVLLGSLTTPLFLLWIWKPIFLFKCGFKLSQRRYWMPFLNIIVAYLSSFICVRLLSLSYIASKVMPYLSFANLALYATVIMVIFIALYLSLMMLVSKGMRGVIIRCKDRIIER